MRAQVPEAYDFFFIQYFRLLFTYPPLVAGRLPDGKKPLTTKPTEFPEGFMASDLKKPLEEYFATNNL